MGYVSPNVTRVPFSPALSSPYRRGRGARPGGKALSRPHARAGAGPARYFTLMVTVTVLALEALYLLVALALTLSLTL